MAIVLGVVTPIILDWLLWSLSVLVLVFRVGCLVNSVGSPVWWLHVILCFSEHSMYCKIVHVHTIHVHVHVGAYVLTAVSCFIFVNVIFVDSSTQPIIYFYYFFLILSLSLSFS